MMRNSRRNKRAQADSIMQNLKLRGIDCCKAHAKKIRKGKQRRQIRAVLSRKEHETKSELSEFSDHIKERQQEEHRDSDQNSNPSEPIEEISSFCSLEEPKISEMFQNSLKRIQEKLKEVYGEGAVLDCLLSDEEKEAQAETGKECWEGLSTEERLLNESRLVGRVKSTLE